MMRSEFWVGDNLRDEDDTCECEDEWSSCDEGRVRGSNVMDIVEE